MCTDEIKQFVEEMIDFRLKNSSELDNFMHIAAIVACKKIVSLSINQSRLKYHCQGVRSIHSEVGAVKKLPYRDSSKNKKHVDLVVIRVTRSGLLANSQPCQHCIKYMSEMSGGYKIDNVYFSDNRGVFKTTLRKLGNEYPKHISRGFLRHSRESIHNKESL